MINFQNPNANINFTGIKIPKFASLVLPKIKDNLTSDVFSKRLEVPESITKDGIDEKTFNRARKFVMKSVNDLYPKESMVIINDGKIAEAVVCDAHSGSMSAKMRRLANSPYNNIVLIHSHPKTGAGTTCPPSIGDWDTLNKYQGIRSMYVINADGEYAILRKIDKRGLSKDKTDEAIGTFTLNYIDYLRKMRNIPACRECVNLFEYGSTLVSDGANPHFVSNRFGELIHNIDHAGLTIDFVHGFWEKFGEKLNVTYETNFSSFC